MGEAGDKFQVFETIIIIITLIAILVVIVKDEKLQVFEAVPGRDRRDSRSDSSRGRSARLEPMVGVEGGGGDGTWPQPGNPTFPQFLRSTRLHLDNLAFRCLRRSLEKISKESLIKSFLRM